MLRGVTNVIIAGLGGQGVITASDVLARAAFRAGFDVKKSETHGMSQRGGSVESCGFAKFQPDAT
jgi:indolepyruvate ferredoxin oxidoreductase beta subunit